MKIGILGCGWLGERVVQKLAKENEIFATVRSNKSRQELEKYNYQLFQIDFENEIDVENASIFQSLDAVIISLPVSRKHHSEKVFQNVSQFLGDYEKEMIFFSSVGVYPQNDGIYIEENTDDLNENIYAAEKFYRSAFPQINILRFGGLMGDDRKFSKYFQNKPLPEPNNPVNHIHYDDITEIVNLLIKNKTHGKLYNVVAPLHPTKQQVLDYEMKEIDSEVMEPKQGRIVSGNLLEKELNYSYLKPNPIYF